VKSSWFRAGGYRTTLARDDRSCDFFLPDGGLLPGEQGDEDVSGRIRPQAPGGAGDGDGDGDPGDDELLRWERKPEEDGGRGRSGDGVYLRRSEPSERGELSAVAHGIVRVRRRGKQDGGDEPAESHDSLRYDELGRLTTTEIDQPLSGGGTLVTSQISYDDALRTRVETDARGNPTTFEMDEQGRVVKVTDAASEEQTFEYDGVRKTADVDKRNQRTEYDYDGLNRVTKVTNALLQDVTTVYDDGAHTVTETDRKGHVDEWGEDLRGVICFDTQTTRLTSTGSCAPPPAAVPVRNARRKRARCRRRPIVGRYDTTTRAGSDGITLRRTFERARGSMGRVPYETTTRAMT
jgi:YD repeat-containing protein